MKIITSIFPFIATLLAISSYNSKLIGRPHETYSSPASKSEVLLKQTPAVNPIGSPSEKGYRGNDSHNKKAKFDGTTYIPDSNTLETEHWELEPMNEATQSKRVQAYKDMKYNRLFTRTRGWNGGDGVFTVGLPDGSVFWTFNDSFYGIVNAADRSRGSSSFPRNSVMLQKAHNGVLGEDENDFVWLVDYVNWSDSTAERYFHARTHLRHPNGEKTAEEIKNGDIDQEYVYWSGDGTVYNGKLQLLWWGTYPKELRALGTSIATYNLEGDIPEDYYRDDIPDYLPKEGDRFYRDSVAHQINDNTVSYGSTLYEAADGHTYLYGTKGYDVLVARTETHDLFSKWQYYVRPSENGDFAWQDEYPTDEEMKRSQIMENNYPCNMPWVFYEDGYYYMTAQGPFFSREVYIYRSKTPYGPFSEQKLLFVLPDKIDKIGKQKYRWLYMVNLHPALSRTGELVFTTNTDADSFWDNFNAPGSADYYRPFFYRVFGWKNLFNEDEANVNSATVQVPQNLAEGE